MLTTIEAKSVQRTQCFLNSKLPQVELPCSIRKQKGCIPAADINVAYVAAIGSYLA